MANDKKQASTLASVATRAVFIIALAYCAAWAGDRFLLPAAPQSFRDQAEKADAYTWDLLQSVAQSVQVKQWR